MSLFSSLVDKFKAIRQHSANKGAFKRRLLEAVADGTLSPEELRDLDALKAELALTDEDVRGFRMKAYLTAFSQVKADGKLTVQEESDLKAIQRYLQLPDGALGNTQATLARLRLLREITEGNLPRVTVPGLVLQKNEVAHWTEPASLLEERVVKRRYEGGSQGFSFRIAKGVSYRVGAHRGHLVTETGIVPISAGDIIITSKRAIFRGDRKSFNTRLDKLLDIQVYSDGARLTDAAGKPRVLQFASRENTDIFGLILSSAVNQFDG
jgi:hypothetical protein